MSDVVIYHNPRCSKSRQTLALLEGRGIRPEVVLYLETPPSAARIQGFLKALGMKPRDLMRKGETEYKALGLDDPKLSDAALVQAMMENPRLIERPIVTRGERVALGRPPENVLKIL
jgi:arsenate reductase